MDWGWESRTVIGVGKADEIDLPITYTSTSKLTLEVNLKLLVRWIYEGYCFIGSTAPSLALVTPLAHTYPHCIYYMISLHLHYITYRNDTIIHGQGQDEIKGHAGRDNSVYVAPRTKI